MQNLKIGAEIIDDDTERLEGKSVLITSIMSAKDAVAIYICILGPCVLCPEKYLW